MLGAVYKEIGEPGKEQVSKKKKQGEVLDLTNINSQASATSESPFSFLGAMAESAETTQSISPSFDSISMDDNKSKIAKRLLGMTDKIEQQDKEIYSLQQRLELLETKIKRMEGR